MKTWAYSQGPRPHKDNAQSAQRGFTLLEMLVILFIVGVVSAVALPQLPLMADRFDFALKRQSFEQELSGLAYRAYSEKSYFVLAGRYEATANPNAERPLDLNTAGIRADLRTRPLDSQSRDPQLPIIMATHISPALPYGWELIVNDPIYFHGTGYCSGGQAQLQVGEQRYTYVLEAPSCKASLAD